MVLLFHLMLHGFFLLGSRPHSTGSLEVQLPRTGRSNWISRGGSQPAHQASYGASKIKKLKKNKKTKKQKNKKSKKQKIKKTKKSKKQKNKKTKKQKIKKTKNQKIKKSKKQKNESFVFFTSDKVECVSCPFRGSICIPQVFCSKNGFYLVKSAIAFSEQGLSAQLLDMLMHYNSNI